MQYFEFLNRVGGNSLVPLGIGRDQRNRNAVHQNIGAAFLAAVHFKIVAGVASGIVIHAAHKTGYQGNELHWVADRSRDFQGEV